MDLLTNSERLMTMNEQTWMRHANPWSVWTRFATLPLISFAVWSRVWIGWYSLVAIALSLFWAWYNPRAFPVPTSTNNWASKGTFGERIFLQRRKLDVASHHVRAANMLTTLSFMGALIWLYGLYALNVWATIAGILGAALPKAWFVDRMVWLYEDMKDTNSVYMSWLR